VRRYFSGALKPPFNRAARDRAGFSASYYQPLAPERDTSLAHVMEEK
jgi:uncharacterized ferritin-like protein (DUF455 family)